MFWDTEILSNLGPCFQTNLYYLYYHPISPMSMSSYPYPKLNLFLSSYGHSMAPWTFASKCTLLAMWFHVYTVYTSCTFGWTFTFFSSPWSWICLRNAWKNGEEKTIDCPSSGFPIGKITISKSSWFFPSWKRSSCVAFARQPTIVAKLRA